VTTTVRTYCVVYGLKNNHEIQVCTKLCDNTRNMQTVEMNMVEKARSPPLVLSCTSFSWNVQRPERNKNADRRTRTAADER
jgi:hypothetical protein